MTDCPALDWSICRLTNADYQRVLAMATAVNALKIANGAHAITKGGTP